MLSGDIFLLYEIFYLLWGVWICVENVGRYVLSIRSDEIHTIFTSRDCEKPTA